MTNALYFDVLPRDVKNLLSGMLQVDLRSTMWDFREALERKIALIRLRGVRTAEDWELNIYLNISAGSPADCFKEYREWKELLAWAIKLFAH
jgi:hypothetical protein